MAIQKQLALPAGAASLPSDPPVSMQLTRPKNAPRALFERAIVMRAIKDALVRQAASPVRWVETIRKMVAMGATHIVECGPGKVLAGMTKRIDPGVQSLTLNDRAAIEQALQGMKA